MSKETGVTPQLEQVRIIIKHIEIELTQIGPPQAERLEAICDELQSAIESLREAA